MPPGDPGDLGSSAQGSSAQGSSAQGLSALSTATAVIALHCVDPAAHADDIAAGAAWLAQHQNNDGGWGDTVKSKSNISTTILCWSALRRVGGDEPLIAKCEAWIAAQ